MNSIKPIIPQSFLPGKIVCGFTSRSGGVSSVPFDTLNCGLNTPDKEANVLRNHALVYNFAEVEKENVALMGQVHGSHVEIVGSGGIYRETDALITSKPGLMLCIQVADCVPLLLNDPVRNIIAAVHCGWKPITSGIAEKCVQIMTEEFSVKPESILAAIGPSAGKCCYEVGLDVAEHLKPEAICKHDSRLHADLKKELWLRLVDTGLIAQHIDVSNECTICNEGLFYSYRRDGIQSGRMLGFIKMKK
ncbi:MAG: peptidoglycan editing factor PgeF [Candidatus Latescibacteria bacterium]|nr:peptidoglycan editing factor PgeF [Candidatus Latescibacterota bacterium]